jgi:hypothetical protein
MYSNFVIQITSGIQGMIPKGLYFFKMSILNSTKIVILQNFKLFQLALLIVTYGC